MKSDRIKELMPEEIKRILRPIYYRLNARKKVTEQRVVPWYHKLKRSDLKLIDLGCGSHPHLAAVVAVEPYVDPVSRSHGKIDIDIFNKRNIKLIQQPMDSDLPFEDKEFDFAYTNHAIEHVDNPAKACSEMIRIAKAGVIVAPFIFADIIFGRSYHKWLIVDRGDTLYFFRKRKEEDRPFGTEPNPFDKALVKTSWYKGSNVYGKISKLIQKYWCSRHKIIEVRFEWKDSFKYVIAED